MKNVLPGIAVVAMLCLVGSVSRAQDTTNAKGKTAEDINKEIASSPNDAGRKSLTADEVKDIAAYLGTLK